MSNLARTRLMRSAKVERREMEARAKRAFNPETAPEEAYGDFPYNVALMGDIVVNDDAVELQLARTVFGSIVVGVIFTFLVIMCYTASLVIEWR